MHGVWVGHEGACEGGKAFGGCLLLVALLAMSVSSLHSRNIMALSLLRT